MVNLRNWYVNFFKAVNVLEFHYANLCLVQTLCPHPKGGEAKLSVVVGVVLSSGLRGNKDALMCILFLCGAIREGGRYSLIVCCTLFRGKQDLFISNLRGLLASFPLLDLLLNLLLPSNAIFVFPFSSKHGIW